VAEASAYQFATQMKEGSSPTRKIKISKAAIYSPVKYWGLTCMPRREPSNMRPCLKKNREISGRKKVKRDGRVHVIVGVFSVAGAAKLNECVTAIVEGR